MGFRLRIALVCAGAVLASAAPAAAQAPGTGPGGPVLVVADGGFGGYYAEILRAEGLNAFAVAGTSALDAQQLAPYRVVVLGQTAVSDAQAAALGAWVQGGGNLIAMRPDPRLATLLGLGADGGDVAQGYLGIDTGTAPGRGIAGTPLQFHGTADRWSGGGARTVATLLDSAKGPTGSAAVTLRDVGTAGGQAASFAYDLARSVVETRQGNPALEGVEGDGEPSALRSSDLFVGWLDFANVRIPQADEQQRLLANLITQMSLDVMPMPRFWYLPRGEKAAVVMTGDDHNQGGTVGQFNGFAAASVPGCSVADWDCIRATSYLWTGTPIMPNQAQALRNLGFELSLHLDMNCAGTADGGIAAEYASQLSTLRANAGNLPSRTGRAHCAWWPTWAGMAKAEQANGVRLDTNYYYWPASWVQNRPGVFTGSGFPMRFADKDGSIVDVYQATTQLTDELGSAPFAFVGDHIRTLLDGALGPEGYYGAFTMNMHTDTATHAGADTIVAEAKARGVPVISAEQLLDWTDGRNGSTFQGLSYGGGALRFTLARASGARGLEAMVPAAAGGGALTSLTRDGAPVAVVPRTVKGVDYAVFAGEPGAYVATYPPAAGPSGPSGGPGVAPDRTKPRVTLRKRTVRVRRNGRVTLVVRCPASEVRCTIDVRLQRKGKRLARKRVTVSGGKSAKVRLRLSRSARRQLATKRKLKVRAVIRTTDAAGNRATQRIGVTLRAPRRR